MRTKLLLLGLGWVVLGWGQSGPVRNVSEAISCPNTPDGSQPYRVSTRTTGNLQRVVLNAPNAVCNDGTPAMMFVRPAKAGAVEPDGPVANRWVIHFVGGSSCSSYEECAQRWCGIGQWEGTLMTSKFEGEAKLADGLMGTNELNRLGNRNMVQLKYCSSDQWQGRNSSVVLTSETDPTRSYSLHFRGASIVDAAMDALERGVAGLPRLAAATDVLISGDSAGAMGARTHLDRLAARLRALNPQVRVRGNFEATFGLDLNGKQGFPAGDPQDPAYSRGTAKFNEVQVKQRNALLDASCEAAHPTAKYLCNDDAYLTANHITTPFFQIQDIGDRLMINGMLEAGLSATPAMISQGLHDQLQSLTRIQTTALERASIRETPGVVARHCGQHVTWSDDDGFLGKRIRSGPTAAAYSYSELLWNWMNGAAPSTLLAPKPPLTPDVAATDTICNAVAPNAPALGPLATGSSASYRFRSAVAPESIVATFGNNLATSTATATANPWPSTLGGVSVNVRDARGVSRAAPLYFVSPGQLLYLIPAGTAAGMATITIGNQQQTIEVAATAPGIYSANQRGDGVAAGTYLKLSSRGVRSEGLLFRSSSLEPEEIPVAAGDQVYLILYGTGLRGGQATATVGDIAVPVAGPVAQGQYEGLDQINLGPLPLRIGPGLKEIVIRQGDALANVVTVLFRAATP